MKFLVIRFSSIGDIVLTSPVVRCLKQQVANAEIHFLTKRSFAETIEQNPCIDKKIYLDAPGLDRRLPVIPQLKKERYDYIIDLHHNLRTLRIKSALGVKSFSYNKINF